MGFSADLLDGFEVLYRRTEGALKVSNEMASFFKKLAIIEQDHAKALAKLAVSYGQKKLVANTHLDGSLRDAWELIIKTVDTFVAKQETYAHSLMKDVSLAMYDYVKDKDNVRKKLTADGQKLTKDMKTQLETLGKVRVNYVKLSKESEAAHAVLSKEQASGNPGNQKKVSQLQQKASQAAEKAAASDQEYKDTLKQTNNKQHDYYHTEMPNLLNEFQQFEEERITFAKALVIRYAKLAQEIPPVLRENADATLQVAEKVDQNADIDKFINENKTGVTPPPPIEYLPADVSPAATTSSAPLSTSSSAVSKGTVSVSGGSGRPSAQKEWGLTAADGSLSVDQKRQKLEQQIVELDAALKIETTTKNGVEKLMQFYANDPVSAKKAEAELIDGEKKIKHLQDSKQLVNTQLSGLNSGGGGGGGAGDSSDGSGGVKIQTATAAKQQQQAQQTPPPQDDAGAGDRSPVLVRVKGLFDYEATCDTELSFKEGDVLNITEQDESGWWYAEYAGRCGFVPQNYVEVLP